MRVIRTGVFLVFCMGLSGCQQGHYFFDDIRSNYVSHGSNFNIHFFDQENTQIDIYRTNNNILAFIPSSIISYSDFDRLNKSIMVDEDKANELIGFFEDVSDIRKDINTRGVSIVTFSLMQEGLVRGATSSSYVSGDIITSNTSLYNEIKVDFKIQYSREVLDEKYSERLIYRFRGIDGVIKIDQVDLILVDLRNALARR